MNLNNFLSYLIESVSIEELKSKVGDSVPQSVLDILASKMKGNKYDNIAMAIIKKIQEIKSDKRTYTKRTAPYIKFLEEHPNVVYAALKKMARDNSSFNAQKAIDDYLQYGPKMTNSSPKKYWYSVYTAEKPQKDKEESGLKNATVKELKDEFLIFPKTQKQTNDLGISENDIDKQWKELRKLSDEIAKKDTSGEEHEGPEGTEYATDNHWCVASSNSNFYNDYKSSGGSFVIVVKKNKDGSPNWNRRYLFYKRGEGYEYEEKEEFADKFNEHMDKEDVLSKEAVKILDNVGKGPSKLEKENSAAEERVISAYHDYKENLLDNTKTKEWQAFRTLINTINKWIYRRNKKTKNEGFFTYGELANTIKSVLEDNNIKNGEDFYKYMSDGRSGRIFRQEEGSYIFSLEKTPSGMIYFKIAANTPVISDRTIVLSYSGSFYDDILDNLKSFAESKINPSKILPQMARKRVYRRTSFSEQKKDFNPNHKNVYGVPEILKDNKKLIAAFERIKKDNQTNTNYLPCGLTVINSSRKLIVRGVSFDKPSFWLALDKQQICDLLDPKMPEKVLKYLDEYDVAYGPKYS